MFQNPIMLAGVGGAAIPLVLHLLSRARYRTVYWGAMMFLDGGDARQRQGLRVKQWALLAVRMVMVAVLAMALARPVLRGGWAGDAGGITAVILLDRSASMAVDEGGVSRFDRAKEAALQVIASLRRGDRVVVMPMGDAGSPTDEPTTDLQAVATRVTTMKASAGAADVAAGLERAAVVLEKVKGAGRELYWIGDRQADSFAGLDAPAMANWRKRWRDPVRFVAIPVGGGAVDNVAVSAVRVVAPPVVRGRAARVEVEVHNYGSTPRVGVPVTISDGESDLASQAVNMGPDSSATVSADVTFADVGSHVISATIRSSGMSLDDRLDYAIDVAEPVKVLIIAGGEDDADVAREAGYARVAMAPYAAAAAAAAGRVGRAGRGADVAAVTVAPAEKWPEDLSAYQVVVLANVGELTDVKARAVEQFVYRGGGLLVAPGNLVGAARYDRWLGKVLPAALDGMTAADGSAATTLGRVEAGHPVFEPFGGVAEPGAGVTVGRYFLVTPGSGGRVIGWYVSGRPFLVDGSFGRGRVLLMTTALDAHWSALPLSGVYVPLVQAAVRYLAGGTVRERNLDVGQAFVADVGAGDARAATVVTPDDREAPAELVRAGGRTEARFDGTGRIGTYSLKYQAGGREHWEQFVVRPPRAESDLTPVTDARWEELRDGLGFEEMDARGDKPISAVLGDRRRGRELWGWLMLAVFALAMAELGLARYWSRGVAG